MNADKVRTSNASILIVDDTHDNLRLLTGILTKQGYNIRPVPEGSLAVVSVRKSLPDLILLDIMMPDISGFEVCEQLKADPLTRDIPIIFISALHEVFDKVKAFSLGGVDYITKPFQVEEVIARVETHLKLRNLTKELQEKNTQLQLEITERIKAEESLTESLDQIEQAKQEWESTADSLSYVVCLLDEQGRIVRSNRTVEHWDLSDVVDVKGKDVHTLFHRDCHDPTCHLTKFLSQAWTLVAQGQTIEREAKDPFLQRYVQVQIRPISHDVEHSSDSFAVLCIHDITKRKRAEESVRQRNAELAVLNQMNTFLQACHTEEETYHVLANVCKELFPSDSGRLYMTSHSQNLIHAVASWGDITVSEQTFTPSDCWCLDNSTSYLVSAPGNEPMCPHLSVAPDKGYVCAPIDTSDHRPGVLHLRLGEGEPGYSKGEYRHHLELKRMVVTRVAEQYALSLANLRLRYALRKESIRDPLTDLYNRRYMEESLQREARRAQRNHMMIGIIIIDVDHFKTFNDTYGHKAGDIVLKEIAALLQSNIRGGDIACRYGGEEFLLLLPEVTEEITRRRGHEILKQVRKLSIPYQGAFFHITVSLGVAILSEHSPDIHVILEAADKALYQAKEQGRNQLVVAAAE